MRYATLALAAASLAAASLAAPSPAVAETRLERQAVARVRDRLRDPESARFSYVATMPSGNVCGLVNAKNGFGGYGGPRGWIYWTATDSVMIMQPGPGADTVYKGVCR